MKSKRPLKRLTREALEPLWSRTDIPIQRIADALGVSRQSVSYKAASLGLPSRKTNRDPMKRGDDDIFRRMWEAGVSSTEMAKYFGYTDASSVSHRRRAMGLPARSVGTVVNAKVRNGRAETIPMSEFLEAIVVERMNSGASV